MKAIACVVALAAFGAVAFSEAPKKTPRDPGAMEQALRVQIFLDRANFGPGKIDGHFGEFTLKALQRYRTSQGQPPPETTNAEDQSRVPDIAGVEFDGPAFVDYTVSEADAEAVGRLPGKPEEQAKLKWLPYASIAEAVAERFHMDVDYLEELNPGRTKGLKPGDVVKVVNVPPLELATIKDLKPGSALEAQGANAIEPDEPQDDAKANRGDRAKDKDGGKDRQTAEDEPRIRLFISKAEKMLEVHDGEKLIAAFPVTVGSEETASPLGDWKVRGVAKWPNFRWDKRMLKEGERSDDFHLLPPGPNNPVGVIWIALNKKGVGIHGSDSPDAIGRNVSHGCIRLANWDIAKLAPMVKNGTVVMIR